MNRVNVLGVGISVINIPTSVQIIDSWIAEHEKHYVCVTPVSSVMEAQRDENFKRIQNNAGLITPDGMPMVWMGRLHGFSEIDRVYGPDLMLAMSELSARKGYSNFFYGGAEGVPQELGKRLQEKFEGFKTAGAFSPPFRPLTPAEDNQVVDMINKSGADILWVGLGAPKQEVWMSDHRNRLEVPVMIGVGAAFDFHTGRVKQAPLWMQRCGMEWLFRLSQEPKRLWRRYLRDNPLFLINIFLQLTGFRKYPILS